MSGTNAGFTSEQVEAQYAQVAELVRREGHAVLNLPATPELASVSFTVGGAARGLPDLIAYGLGPELGPHVMNNAFQVLQSRWPFENWTRSEQVLENFAVIFRDVSRSDLLMRVMFLTSVYNIRNKYLQTPILQVCWPDDAGRFPFEKDCQPDIAIKQRVRGLRS